MTGAGVGGAAADLVTIGAAAGAEVGAVKVLLL
jgi:hypothetical protein